MHFWKFVCFSKIIIARSSFVVISILFFALLADNRKQKKVGIGIVIENSFSKYRFPTLLITHILEVSNVVSISFRLLVLEFARINSSSMLLLAYFLKFLTSNFLIFWIILSIFKHTSKLENIEIWSMKVKLQHTLRLQSVRFTCIDRLSHNFEQ